jgi:16S rRNA (uracil1498-N3)-methyltransferase
VGTARDAVVSLPVFQLDPLPSASTVRLDGPEGHHAATVRRLRVGEELVLADGRGARRVGRVSWVGRDQLDVECGPIEVVPAPDPRLVVVQALPKGDRAELALELLTELGADEIVPWAAERSVVQWRGDRASKSLIRWRRAVVEAGKQSRRVRFPVVTEPVELGGLSRRIADAAAGLVLHEDAIEGLPSVTLPGTGEVVVVVGPEGGISPGELDVLTAAGAVAVRLGEPVLRTSTAGGAALAVLGARLGRWS